MLPTEAASPTQAGASGPQYLIRFPLCIIIKMPAFREDKFSAGRTKCMSPMLKNNVEQSRTIPNSQSIRST